MARRQERVNDLLREVLAEIIARELKDPRLTADLISVTEVHTSADLQHARVRVSVMGSESEREAVITALNHSRNFVQRQLRPHLNMKSIPQVRFERDDRIEDDRRILDLLDRIQRDGLPRIDPVPSPDADPAADAAPPADDASGQPRVGLPGTGQPDAGQPDAGQADVGPADEGPAGATVPSQGPSE